MNFSIFKKKAFCAFGIVFQGVLIAAVTIFAVIPISCKVSTEGIELVQGDYDSPILKELKVIDDKTIEIEFSESVKIRSAVVSPFIDGVSDSYERSITTDLSRAISSAVDQNGALRCSSSVSDDGKKITFILESETLVGKRYEILGIVEDLHGNSLTFCVPFTGFNPCIPKVLITEIQPKYKGTEKSTPVYKCEFAELLILEDGNLAGLEVFFASYASKITYELPAVDVHKGDVVLVHLRSGGDGCITETDDSLDASTRIFSNNHVRDLWSENKSKCLNVNNDILIVRNIVTQKVVDGVMFSDSEISGWEGESASFAQELVDAGIYSSVDISNATNSGVGTSLKNSMQRIDASDIQEKILNGELRSDAVIVQAKNVWKIEPITAGTLR